MRNLMQKLEEPNCNTCISVLDYENKVAIYRNVTGANMLNSSGSIEQWFTDLSKKTNMQEVIIVPFDISNGVLKMQERFILSFKNTPAEYDSEKIKRIKSAILQKHRDELEQMKILQSYIETQIIMYAKGQCSYEELRSVSLIVKEEIKKLII